MKKFVAIAFFASIAASAGAQEKQTLKSGTVACIGGIEHLVFVNHTTPKLTRDGKTIACK